MQALCVSISPEESITRFTCTGIASLAGYLDLIHTIKSAMADPSLSRKVFVDISGVDGSIPEMDKFTLGEQAAIQLLGLQIGVLMNPHVSVNHFGENTAVNRGVSLRVGYEESELLAWFGIPVSANPGKSKSRRFD